MLIGAHVSTAGGVDNAVARGVELECDAIQIFNQSPRMWRPTESHAGELAAFHEAFDESRLGSVVIHAVYLINTTSADKEIREKSLDSLIHALRLGDGIGADGVVLHAGSRKGEPLERRQARARARSSGRRSPSSESCPLLFENTAGTQGPLGRDFDELARLSKRWSRRPRLGVCLDCCHLFASGYDIVDARGPDAPSSTSTTRPSGSTGSRCLHVNDSRVPLGANRDMHANVGEGEMGEIGIATFLSEPRFENAAGAARDPGPRQEGGRRRRGTRGEAPARAGD